MNKEPPSLFFTTSELVLDISPRSSPPKVYKSEPPLKIVSTSPGQLTATSTPSTADKTESFDNGEEAEAHELQAKDKHGDHSRLAHLEISTAAEGSPLLQENGAPKRPSLVSPADASTFRPAAITSFPSQGLLDTRIAAIHIPQLEPLQSQLQNLKIENISWQQRAERSEADLHAAQRDADRWQREAKQWRERCEHAEENHDVLQHRADAAAVHVGVLDSATASMQERNLSLEKALAELKAAHLATKEEVQRSREQNESLSSELAVKHDELTTLSREHRRLLIEVGTLKERVGSLTNLVERLASSSSSATVAPASVMHASQIEAFTSMQVLKPPPSGLRELDGETKKCDEGRVSPRRTEPRSDEAMRAVDACIRCPEQRCDKEVAKHEETRHQFGSTHDSSNRFQDMRQRQTPRIAQDRSAHDKVTASVDRTSPFHSARALIHRTAELESSLLALNMERQSLENELNRFPSGSAGRTVAERRKKAAVEERLFEVNKQVSGVKRELRSLGGI